MLSVAPAAAVHCTDTPGSTSKHSSLSYFATADKRLKRSRSPDDTFNLDRPEITLYKIRKTNAVEHVSNDNFASNKNEVTANNFAEEELVKDANRNIINNLQNQINLKKENNTVTCNGNPIVLNVYYTPDAVDIDKQRQLLYENKDANKFLEENERKVEGFDSDNLSEVFKSEIDLGGETQNDDISNKIQDNLPSISEEVTIEPRKPLRGKSQSRLEMAKNLLITKNASPLKVAAVNDVFENLDHTGNLVHDSFGEKKELFTVNEQEPHFVDCGIEPIHYEDDYNEPLFESIQREQPFYSMGFPNPPGANRCWLNATLHAIFALPLLSNLDKLDLPECSKLFDILRTLQKYWRRGVVEKKKIYNTITNLKDELKVLDDSYPSECQQDVSEFLTIFFNFIKSDFGKLTLESKKYDEIENVPSNHQQDPLKRSPGTSMSDATKRLPLADISAYAGQHGNNHVSASSQLSQCSIKSKSDMQTSADQTTSNPVDEYFFLSMIETYTCEGCEKKREQKIENLMLFVDLPTQEFPAINLSDLINRTFATEHRNLTCEVKSCHHQIHTMETRFSKFPKILIIQVKRYEMSFDGEINKKCTSVNIPKLLKLDSSKIFNSNDLNETAEYRPISIISHVGSSMDCGHYTSYVRYGEQWFYYNDLEVKVMTTEQALKATQRTAYLIFFKDVTLSENDW